MAKPLSIKKSLKRSERKIGSLFKGGENQLGSLVLLVVLVVGALGYFAFRPLNISYKQTKIQIANLKNEKMSLDEKKIKLENLEQEIKDNKEFVEKVKDIVPTTPGIPEVLVTLENLADSYGLYITNFVPREPEETARQVVRGGSGTSSAVKASASKWKTVEVRLDMTGSYSSLRSFVQGLEKNIRPFNIKTISINGGGETSGGTTTPLRFGIVADIYYQPEQ